MAARRDARVMRTVALCLDFCGLPLDTPPHEVRAHVQSVAEELHKSGRLSKRQLRELRLWHKAAHAVDVAIDIRRKRAEQAAEQLAEQERQKRFAIGGME